MCQREDTPSAWFLGASWLRNSGRPDAQIKPGEKAGLVFRTCIEHARISRFASFGAGGMKRYMCVICGFIYDEANGLPEEGIPPGTRWDDLPPNWSCPDCGARKEDFEIMGV